MYDDDSSIYPSLGERELSSRVCLNLKFKSIIYRKSFLLHHLHRNICIRRARFIYSLLSFANIGRHYMAFFLVFHSRRNTITSCTYIRYLFALVMIYFLGFDTEICNSISELTQIKSFRESIYYALLQYFDLWLLMIQILTKTVRYYKRINTF